MTLDAPDDGHKTFTATVSQTDLQHFGETAGEVRLESEMALAWGWGNARKGGTHMLQPIRSNQACNSEPQQGLPARANGMYSFMAMKA